MTRPTDTWLICGRPVLPESAGSGCTCAPNDPTRRLAEKALDRLDSQDGGPVRTAPRVTGAGDAGRRGS